MTDAQLATRVNHCIHPTSNAAKRPNAALVYRYGPPVASKRLLTSANVAANSCEAKPIATIRIGLQPPTYAASDAGRAKTAPPMTWLMPIAVRSQRPSSRRSSATAVSCIMKAAMEQGQVVVKPRDVMPEGARTLPARYYTDPALFNRELDGLFGTMWFYVGRSEEAAKPGQYFVREINGYNIVITRNAAGAIRASHNPCRHRGTRLCEEKTGQFSG